MRRTGVGVAVAALLTVAPNAAADEITLPSPDAVALASTALLRQLPGFRADRLLASEVPGPVANTEVVRVGIGGDGSVAQVLLDQSLTLSGVGDYAIRERGPARSATSLSPDPPPVTRRGAVVWQGFSPGSRALSAELVLDPAIEAEHLPLSVQVAFTGKDGRAVPLAPGGGVPAAGTVTVTIRNDTQQPSDLPTARDVAASLVAGPLDRALLFARHSPTARLPTTSSGLPTRLQVSGAAQVAGAQAVPFHVTGSLIVTGTQAAVDGPATTAQPGGASFAGVLGGVDGAPSVTFTVTTSGAGQFHLDLAAGAALDPRALAPPRGLRSWRAWAASRPPVEERQAALSLLVEVAATGARARSYSPYLGADLAGTGTTTFHYAFAPPPSRALVVQVLHPRWGAIGLAVLALLLILTNASLIWRRL